MTEAEKIKFEFNSFYNQTHYKFEVKDEEEIEFPVVKEEEVFTENPILVDRHPVEIQPAKKSKKEFSIKKIQPKPPENNKVEHGKISEHVEIIIENKRRIFQCRICKKIFDNIYSINAHIQRHLATERNLICQECGAGFKVKDCLDTHLKRHAEVKQFGTSKRFIW